MLALVCALASLHLCSLAFLLFRLVFLPSHALPSRALASLPRRRLGEFFMIVFLLSLFFFPANFLFNSFRRRRNIVVGISVVLYGVFSCDFVATLGVFLRNLLLFCFFLFFFTS